LVANSPGLFAGSYVLHRLLVPRHPPIALSSLSKLTTKMLASTMQFSKYGRAHRLELIACHPMDGRSMRTGPGHTTAPAESRRSDVHEVLGASTRSLRTQQRASVLRPISLTFHAANRSTSEIDLPLHLMVNVPQSEAPSPRDIRSGNDEWTPTRGAEVLLRKEVIQPHLPVRLPCYDFVLIASPTFDGSLHKGWATGFGCCRLS
jgi:hypothetical protein